MPACGARRRGAPARRAAARGGRAGGRGARAHRRAAGRGGVAVAGRRARVRPLRPGAALRVAHARRGPAAVSRGGGTGCRTVAHISLATGQALPACDDSCIESRPRGPSTRRVGDSARRPVRRRPPRQHCASTRAWRPLRRAAALPRGPAGSPDARARGGSGRPAALHAARGGVCSGERLRAGPGDLRPRGGRPGVLLGGRRAHL